MPLLWDGACSDGAPGSKAFGNPNPQTPSGLMHGLDACAAFITVPGLSPILFAAAAQGDAQHDQDPSTWLKPQHVGQTLARHREE